MIWTQWGTVLLNNSNLFEVLHSNFTDLPYWHEKYNYLREKLNLSDIFKLNVSSFYSIFYLIAELIQL